MRSFTQQSSEYSTYILLHHELLYMNIFRSGFDCFSGFCGAPFVSDRTDIWRLTNNGKGRDSHDYFHAQLLCRTHRSCSLVVDNVLYIAMFAFFVLFVRYHFVSYSLTCTLLTPLLFLHGESLGKSSLMRSHFCPCYYSYDTSSPASTAYHFCFQV